MATKVNVREKLAYSLGRKDHDPNKALGEELVTAKNSKGVEDLFDLILIEKNEKLMGDAIKALFEASKKDPVFMSTWVPQFIQLLERKVNNLQWGAMVALCYISEFRGASVYEYLGRIIQVAERGSVITRDHLVKTLCHLGMNPALTEEMGVLLLEMIHMAPVNQFPTYIEEACKIVEGKQNEALIQIIYERLPELKDHPAKKKRMEKVLKRLMK